MNDTLNTYLANIQESFARQDYDASLLLSRRLTAIGDTSGYEKPRLYGLIYIAQSYLGMAKMDSVYHYFELALPLAEKENDFWALATIYNALGGNAVFGEGNYSKGITYLTEGVKYAKDIQDTSRLILIEGNLAMAYYFMNDTTGLNYARDVFRMGNEAHKEYSIFVGSLICANLHWMVRDTVNALAYIESALPYVGMYDSTRETYALYADILLAMGEKDRAEMYYKEALDESIGVGLFSLANRYIGYAECLKERHEYDDAIKVLQLGLLAMDTIRSPINKHLIYYNLAEIYQLKSDYRTALSYFQKFYNEENRQLNIDTQRKINTLRMQYENQKHELELLAWKNKYNLMVMILVLSVFIFMSIYIWYYNRTKNYRQLLKQHQAALEKQEPKSQQMPEDKMSEMFDRLEKLMRETALYRQSDLSRDKVAQMLSTNRTYLSSVIKMSTGMTFTYYVNSFRINEAVKILSNPEDETPIKAIAADLGYNNLTTFYRLFEAAKGIPPSKYRETFTKRQN